MWPPSASVLATVLLPSILMPPALAGQGDVALPVRDRPLEVIRELRYEVSGSDGLAWAEFGEVTDLAFDTGGRLYLVDRKGPRIVVLSPNGELVREIGHAGDGPGEFRDPRSIAALPDGSVVVHDGRSRRLLRFDSAGTAIGDERLTGMGVAIPSRIYPHPDGVVTMGSLFQVNGEPMVRTSDGMQPATNRPLQLLHTNGVLRRDLHAARFIDRPSFEAGSIVLNAYYPEFRMAVTPNGTTLVSDTGAYMLTVIGPQGGAPVSVRRDIPRHPVTAELRSLERQRIRDEIAAGRPPVMGFSNFGGGGSNTSPLRQYEPLLTAMRFADSLPAIRAIAADHLGRGWLERSPVDPRNDGPIDVIGSDLRYVGTVPAGAIPFPRAFGPGGLVAIVTLDEFDVPTIRVEKLTLRLVEPRE